MTVKAVPSSSASRSRLPAAYLSLLLRIGKSIECPESQILYRKGDPSDGCYWVVKGVIKITASSPRGAERILAVIGPGSVLGVYSPVAPPPRTATAEALCDCQLVFLNHAVFENHLREHPEALGHFIAGLVDRLRQAEDEIAEASFLSVKARVARALLMLADQVGVADGPDLVGIDYGFRQADIAAMAGIARESVTRTLSEWRRDKVVGSSPRFKLVIHKARLSREVAAVD
jgi:CRP/FNR family transcriptional regulator, cyclic AMP receptor protein